MAWHCSLFALFNLLLCIKVWPEPVIITTQHAGFACAGIDLPSATISIITWVMVSVSFDKPVIC
jgi:hypothetical protein